MDDSLALKARIYEQCRQQVDEKLQRLDQAFKDSRESLQAEARSTAGDKHETGRAMIQLEQEKMQRQLQESRRLAQMLQRVPYQQLCRQVQSGALVETTEGRFFIAVGIGPLLVDGREYFIIAPSSPLAQSMLAMKVGDKFAGWGQSQEILAIC